MAIPVSSDTMQPWVEGIASFAGEILLKASFWAIVFAVVAFGVALIVMWMIHRAKLLRRVPGWWNVLAKASYLLILVAMPLAGALAGAAFGTQHVVDGAVDANVEHVLAAQMPAVRQQIGSYLAPMAADTVITVGDFVQPLMAGLAYTPASRSWVERKKAHIINDIVLGGGTRILTVAFQQAMRALPDLLPTADNGAQDQLVHFTVANAVKVLGTTGGKVDFSPLDDSVPRVFSDALRRQIDGFFRGVYIGIVLKLLLVALLVGGEMLFYFRYWLPRRQKAEEAPPAAAGTP